MVSAAGEQLRQLLMRMPGDAELRRIVIENNMTWNFTSGYAPRTFTGNWRTPEEVRMVLIMAEPSTPYSGESYSEDPETWFQQAVLDQPTISVINSTKPHSSRSGWFLHQCGFDPANAQETWQKVVQFNSLWLTIDTPLGKAPEAVTDYFGRVYLSPILRFFPNATIVAAGGKAISRVHSTKIEFVEMGALSPPGCFHTKVISRQMAVAQQVKENARRASL